MLPVVMTSCDFIKGLLNPSSSNKPSQVKDSKMEYKQAQKEFLENNKKKEGVQTTSSGLQYKILTEGTGQKPQARSTVEVHYQGTLINGAEFDSSYKRGQTIKFPLNQVIAGWTEGLQLMKEGATHELYIPSHLAYGERDMSAIPAGSTLIFKVELIKVL